MTPEITLDDKHVYRVAGRVVPGVTGIIKACGLMDLTWATDYARDRGTAVHRAVELYEQGDLDIDTLDPKLALYLAAWVGFRMDTGYRSTTQEQIVHNKTYNYAGTLDQTGTIDGKTCLIDIKTGVFQHWWAIQTSSYNAVAKCKRRLSLELHGDGKYKIIEHTDKRDWPRFLACLTVAGMKEAWK